MERWLAILNAERDHACGGDCGSEREHVRNAEPRDRKGDINSRGLKFPLLDPDTLPGVQSDVHCQALQKPDAALYVGETFRYWD